MHGRACDSGRRVAARQPGDAAGPRAPTSPPCERAPRRRRLPAPPFPAHLKADLPPCPRLLLARVAAGRRAPSAGGVGAPERADPEIAEDSFGLTPAAEDAAAAWRQQGDVRPPMGRDPTEAPKGALDRLPDWVGYGFLYFISIAPVLIALGAITVLFLNSLR